MLHTRDCSSGWESLLSSVLAGGGFYKGGPSEVERSLQIQLYPVSWGGARGSCILRAMQAYTRENREVRQSLH